MAKPKKVVKKITKKAKTTTKTTSLKAPVKKMTKTKASGSVTLNKKVPGFLLDSTAGGKFDLSKVDHKYVVLYFYPRDATPGCTVEGHDFSKLLEKFKASDAVVYGVSRDSMASHEKFKQKEGYSVDLLSDADEKVCNIFGVIKDKNMYGKKVRGIERSTFLINKEGQLLKEWRGVKVPGHAEEVLEFVKNL